MKTTIALVGPIAGGKGTVAELLIRKGYSHFTYGEEVKKEILRRGLPLERSIYQDVSDSMRLELGMDILAQRLAETVEQERRQGRAEKAIIDGLRHPDEVTWLKQNYRAYVIGVTAPPEIRFQRFLARSRPSDPVTREGFEFVDNRDRGIGQPEYGQQGDACLPLSDYLIVNTGTSRRLEEKLQEGLVNLGIEGNPSFKEGRY